MFFSQIVLAKRGSLGKIWLAGHWDKKLAKNVVFKTNIPKSVKTILNPHSPMALRMTSHLLLGVVRIFSKKAKYLLNDCTEAVVKLKGLSKTVSKIDLPTEQDHQALLTSGPRQSDKPQVYQEVDRFLRNIDIRDLVVDPLYDPNKLEPVEKPDYSEFFGVADEADLGVEQTPNNNGTNNLIFDGTTTVTPASDRRFKSDELREKEQDTMIATPDSALVFGQGKTPESTKSNIEMLIGDNINPLFNINLLDTPVLPKTPQQQLDFDDEGVVEFANGMMGDQDNQPQQPYDESEGINMRHDDDHYAGPGDREEDYQQPQFDENGQPITPAKSVVTDKDSAAGGEVVGNIQDQLKDTTATAAVVEEKTEFEIQQLQQQLLLEKQKEIAEKNKPKATRRARVLGSTLSNNDIKKFKNTKALTVERSILPSNIRVIVTKTKEIPAKQQLLSAIRKNISNTFHNLYGQLLENKYPKVVQAAEEPYLSFLRSRIMYNRTIKNQELTESLQADGVTATDLGIPTFEQDIDEIYEKKVEAALLTSINNRIIADGSNLIAPSEKKKLKSQPFSEQDKELINRLEEEFEARANNKQPLFYKPDSNNMLREENEELGVHSSPGSDIFKRNQQLLEEEERQRLLREQDMGAQFGVQDEDNAGIGGYEHVENPLFNYDDETNIPEDRYSLTSAQPQQEEKKILSQKTANMHAILDKHFAQKNVINFLDDIVKPQQQVNPNNTRVVAACYFYELLVLKTKVLVDLKQPESDETYPDIQITKTSQFNNEFTVVKNVDL